MITQDAGINSKGTLNCLHNPALSMSEVEDSCNEEEKQIHGSIPEMTYITKFSILTSMIWVNTKDITKEINNGVITAHKNPIRVLEYLFFKFFITKFLSNDLFVMNSLILKALYFIKD